MNIKHSDPCPCGGPSLGTCCGPYLSASELPPTAEATMRSRYSAFVTQNPDHLFRTWHGRTRPKEEINTGYGWIGLEIIDVVAGTEADSTGIVEFIAKNVHGDIHERSRFDKRAGRWMYVDAEDASN
ncbi:MAG: zinc chelation protein SecC [Trueperella sp.]|nr:zinc chelation protein SecC [Trueperella sp.]